MKIDTRIAAVMSGWADAGDDVPEELKIIRELRESVRFYEDRLRPTTDHETGATEDEIDRLTLALELTTQDKKRFATNLYDLQEAVMEALVEIESMKIGTPAISSHEVLHDAAYDRAIEIIRKHTEAL